MQGSNKDINNYICMESMMIKHKNCLKCEFKDNEGAPCSTCQVDTDMLGNVIKNEYNSR